MKIKNYLMPAVGFGILVGSIILGQPFVSHSQNQVPPIPVEVINTPLEIRTVEAPPCCVPRQPFRKQVALSGRDGESSGLSDFVVPTGKRLVIENVSVIGKVPHGEQLEVGFTYHFATMRQFFPLTLQLTNEPVSPIIRLRDNFVASQQMRVYVESGDAIGLFGTRFPVDGFFEVVFYISGFLVDLP